MARRLTGEASVVAAIRQFAKLCPGLWLLRIQQGLGCHPGIADLIGSYQGRAVAIEVKAPGRRVKPGSPQDLFLEAALENGWIAFEADSFEAFLHGFERFGVYLPVKTYLPTYRS